MTATFCVSDRAINDALGLPETTEPIAVCIDFSALPLGMRLLEGVRLMHRHPPLCSPPVHRSGDPYRIYLSRSVVERLTGGAP